MNAKTPKIIAGYLLSVSTLVVALALGRTRSIDDASTAFTGSSAGEPVNGSLGSAGVSAEPGGAPPDVVVSEASEAERDAANDVASLTRLSERYPNDGLVSKKLALLLIDDPKQLLAAIGATKRALVSGVPLDDPLKAVIFRAANGPPNTADVAFEIMGRHLKSRGPDLLYELMIAQGVAVAVKQRAQAAIEEPAVRTLASPALSIALALKKESACGRKKLLPEAEQKADARSLEFLTPMMAKKGCGFLNLGDCYACINRVELSRTITAIRSRSNK